jgi:glycosyltransferase involved in cell wall biosynthesis
VEQLNCSYEVIVLTPIARRARAHHPSTPGRVARAARILIVTPQPFYEDRGTPIAVRYVARALGDLGIDTDILAFPVGRDVELPHTRISRCANPLGLRSVPIGFSWRKVAMDLSLSRAFARRIATRRYDIVHAVEDAAYIAAFLCPRYQQPFIYDMASAIPLELQYKFPFGTAIAQRFMQSVERRVFESARHVVCSAGLADYVRARSPIAAVSEWRFPAHTVPVDAEQVTSLRRRLHIPARNRVLLYSGSFARYQGVDLLVDAFRLVRKRDSRLSLVCVGATAREVRDWTAGCALHGLDRVHFVERQRREQMPCYLQLADCLVSPRTRGPNLPLKLFDYMATGKPIIATRGSPHQPLLSEGRALLSEPTAEALADTIVSTLNSPVEAQAAGLRAQQYAAQHLNWGQFVQLVRDIYCDALQRDPSRRRCDVPKSAGAMH